MVSYNLENKVVFFIFILKTLRRKFSDTVNTKIIAEVTSSSSKGMKETGTCADLEGGGGGPDPPCI